MLEKLNEYVQIERSQDYSASFVEDMIRSDLYHYKYNIDDRYFDLIKDNDCYEICTFDGKLLSCSLETLKMTSFTPKELLEKSWADRVDRLEIYTQMINAAAKRLIVGESTVEYNVTPKHLIREAKDGGKFFCVEIRAIIPLQQRGKPVAGLALYSCDEVKMVSAERNELGESRPRSSSLQLLS